MVAMSMPSAVSQACIAWPVSASGRPEAKPSTVTATSRCSAVRSRREVLRGRRGRIQAVASSSERGGAAPRMMPASPPPASATAATTAAASPSQRSGAPSAASTVGIAAAPRSRRQVQRTGTSGSRSRTGSASAKVRGQSSPRSSGPNSRVQAIGVVQDQARVRQHDVAAFGPELGAVAGVPADDRSPALLPRSTASGVMPAEKVLVAREHERARPALLRQRRGGERLDQRLGLGQVAAGVEAQVEHAGGAAAACASSVEQARSPQAATGFAAGAVVGAIELHVQHVAGAAHEAIAGGRAAQRSRAAPRAGEGVASSRCDGARGRRGTTSFPRRLRAARTARRRSAASVARPSRLDPELDLAVGTDERRPPASASALVERVAAHVVGPAVVACEERPQGGEDVVDRPAGDVRSGARRRARPHRPARRRRASRRRSARAAADSGASSRGCAAGRRGCGRCRASAAMRASSAAISTSSSLGEALRAAARGAPRPPLGSTSAIASIDGAGTGRGRRRGRRLQSATRAAIRRGARAQPR